MLNALFKLPRESVQALIVWALGGEPVLRADDPPYDAAELDAVVAEIKTPA